MHSDKRIQIVHREAYFILLPPPVLFRMVAWKSALSKGNYKWIGGRKNFKCKVKMGNLKLVGKFSGIEHSCTLDHSESINIYPPQ